MGSGMKAKDWIYHRITGNDAPAPQVGLTRGLIAAALSELVFIVVRSLPLPAELENDILTHTAALVILASFVLWGFFDGWFKERKK